MSWRDFLTPTEVIQMHVYEQQALDVKRQLVYIQMARRRIMKRATDRWTYDKSKPKERPERIPL